MAARTLRHLRHPICNSYTHSTSPGIAFNFKHCASVLISKVYVFLQNNAVCCNQQENMQVGKGPLAASKAAAATPIGKAVACPDITALEMCCI